MALGWRQSDCLQKMLEHGGVWHPTCGWFYGESKTETLRIMQSLTRRGLVTMHATVERIEWQVVDPERAYAAIFTASLPASKSNIEEPSPAETPLRASRRAG